MDDAAYRPNFPGLLRDAAAASVVAALLAFPLLGFKLNASAQGLALDVRLVWVLYAAAAVFAGRLLFSLGGQAIASRLAARPARVPRASARPAVPGATRLYVGAAMMALAFVLPWLPFSDRNLIDKATLILIYVMLGWGLNIVVGLAGLLDLGYVAFYAVGAYSYALLSSYFGLSFWICLPLAGLLSGAFGIALGFPVLRLRGDYLAIVTLGFGEIVREVIINWGELTGGPNGLTGIARPSFFGLPMMPPGTGGGVTFSEFFGLPFSPYQRIVFLYYLILALALATNLFTLSASGGCPSAAPGRRFAKTRSPAAASASIRR